MKQTRNKMFTMFTCKINPCNFLILLLLLLGFLVCA